GGIWDELKLAYQSAKGLHFSDAIDHVLSVIQKLNGLLGVLSIWLTIVLVAGGAIIGAFFGGAALPGAAAGLALAAEIGGVLLAASAITEAAIIEKAKFNLSRPIRDAQRRQEYDRIAGSVLTLGILGALFLLGKIADKLAKGIIARFRGTVPEAPAIGE